MKRIDEIDTNMKTIVRIDRSDVFWRDAACGLFDIRGLYSPYLEKEPPVYSRLPDEIGLNTSEGVAGLYRHTAGGRVRFMTDSEYVAIRCIWDGVQYYNRMPASGSRGFDIYVYKNGRNRYYRSFVPPAQPAPETEGYESLLRFYTREEREITINFPLYNGVRTLEIGLEPGAAVQPGRSYRTDRPVVYYGSSITQGGCASRPGNSFPAMISELLDTDHINLGFSGSAKGERLMAEYIASLEMSAFVMDYDNNAPSPEWLQLTHYPFYRIIRDAQPELPIICVSRPDKPIEDEGVAQRRETVRNTVARAMAEGDRHICFVDGGEFFAGGDGDMCTVDSTHPTDLGFYYMAETLAPVVERMLNDCREA